MITGFLASWELFQNAYLAGWLMGFLLALIGVLVVARDQIFIGVAVSQASTLGIAVGLVLGSLLGQDESSWLRAEGFLSCMAVIFAVIAALLTAGGGRVGDESHEAVTGWVFLVSASLAILLVSRSPHGLDEIHRLLSSSIIGATATEVWTFGSLAVCTALTLGIVQKRVLLVTVDPAMAAAVGMRVSLWAGGMAIWLGLVIGLSMRVSGMLYTFGNLVLPALIAKNLCQELRTVFVVAPSIAVGMGVIGFVLANHYDYPPAQMTVALLGFILILAWGYRCYHARDSGRA